MSTYRSRPNKFLRKFQRSPFFLLSKSENSNAFFSYSKNRPVVELKERRDQTATTNSIRTGSPPPPPLLPQTPPTNQPPPPKKSVDITSVKSSKQKGRKKRQVVINSRNGQMVPALFITVGKDNESGNKTGAKLRARSFSWETQPRRAVRLYTHT